MDTCHQIVLVQVEGHQSSASGTASVSSVTQEVSQHPVSDSLKVMIDIRISTDIHIRQKNLSYQGLKDLVEKLEVLC